ncbi:hypothetical protein METBIDRAFT_46528 [Metschnikowia bicuspidata var. bicuspidata NRRL YB-4993]|uniref:Amino acid permease/ SLC12A domain-containing protein n=1 Tax=Metschnikowia bicuspidata var. bicuspidata NRRL YB-4993 TaxID=869754 RepID=A0A1A0H5C6_9ASCO|nr:hypothetical protein METBIDRAFT_46528 [Metschnikowia bicuspidata var. bicuspidata NRRL YB-4993]OBA19123.1 hypothetical protein METBIDRAFT_46528 [Metschnikowia bicuspidata var. bicuspidata NRRL YB-4993]
MGTSKFEDGLRSVTSALDPIISEIKPYASDEPQPKVGFWESFQRKEEQEVRRKDLKMAHLSVIALSSGMGTGLLVGSASKLRSGGPLSLLIAYALVGLMCICTMNAVGELTVAYPDLEGGFNEWYRKFLDESMAFALGWNYLLQWMTTISLELVTSALTIKYWNTTINSDVFVAIFFVVICLINFFGVRGYAEAEFIMNSIKLITLTGFVIMGLCIDLGASPSGFIGGEYWRDPGAFTSFKGLVTVFATASFSMGGTEFLALSVSEVRNPRTALPVAIRLVFVRIIFFYLGTLLFVGLLVPRDSDRLMGSGGSSTSASPYVLAADLHGVKVIPHIMNAVILNSVTSVATAAMYSSSRLLRSLAVQGYAPKWFDYTDKAGRPLRAWLITILAGAFAFIATYEKQDVVFNWLLSIVALSIVIIWPSLCLCHLRWRAALKHNNVPLESLGFVSYTGEIGSYYSIVINILILIGQFWVALFPDGDADVNYFFQNYLTVPFTLLCYIGHKTWTRSWRHFYIKTADIDITTGRTIVDSEVLELDIEEKQQKLAAVLWWKKPFIWFFN